MATVSEPRSFNAAETQRRVRHPLETLRDYIRWYVVLEGAANALIYLALCFWIGLALDYGCFALFDFDWIQELEEMTSDAHGQSSGTALSLRIGLLAIVSIGLLVLVAWKIFFRITREFKDTALALVLERRFPSKLGERLITAVELADPKLAEKYGYSRALVERTIQDAADLVETMPVKRAFNWTRLYVLGMWCGILTLGLYLLTGIGAMVLGAIVDRPLSPLDYFWKFNDVAATFTERNMLLRDSYWPRDAYLEIVRFQDNADHPNEMRVGRDEERPDILVRAYEWVMADRHAPGGWRPLRWSDLGRLLGQDVVARVNIPSDWPGWVVDLDDVDAAIPTGTLPASWKGKTTGEIRQELAQPSGQAILNRNALVKKAVDDLLDWRAWSVDKILLQEQKGEVRRLLRDQLPQAHDALMKDVLEQLAVLAESPSYSRTLRRLELPSMVEFFYRGESRKSSKAIQDPKDNLFEVPTSDLTESVRFTVRAANYYTPYKRITLVPPPGLKSLAVDKQEPAYKYHRLQGDQTPLKGKKQVFSNYPISVTGDISTVEVLIGSNITLYAEADRPLKMDSVRIVAPSGNDTRGALVPQGVDILQNPARSSEFFFTLNKITKTHEFFLEFHDRDNVKGRRRVRIVPVDDRPPEVLDFELDVVLRKPKFKFEPGRTTAAPDGYLITPNALLPFKGTIRDDYGLTNVAWVFEVEEREVELVGSVTSLPTQTSKDSLPTLVIEGSAQERRAAIVVSGFQFLPTTPGFNLAAPWYWSFQSAAMQADLKRKRAYPEELKTMESFLVALEGRAADEVPLNALEQALTKRPSGRGLLKELSLKDKDRFLFPVYLKKLRSPDPQRQAQLHYLVRISVMAKDNNVETGPNEGRSKSSIPLLVVSENELLSQIALEEEVLRDRLEKAMVKLRDAKTFIDDAISRLTGSPDYVIAAERVSQTRNRLLDAGTTAREVFNDCRRILEELEVNQVRQDKIKHTRFQIVLPLGEIVDPNIGNFTLTEQAIDKVSAGVEDDLAAKRGEVNVATHLSHAKEARAQLERLIQKLNEVLIAMDEGVVESKLLELIVNIERDQRTEAERLRRIYDDWVADLLQGITDLTTPKSKDKK